MKNSINRQEPFGLSIQQKVYRVLTDAFGIRTSEYMSFKDFTCHAKPKLYIREFTSAAFSFYCQYPECNVHVEPENLIKCLYSRRYRIAWLNSPSIPDNAESRLYLCRYQTRKSNTVDIGATLFACRFIIAYNPIFVSHYSKGKIFSMKAKCRYIYSI